jgi:Tfp pilus assembly PilM family ATPase
LPRFLAIDWEQQHLHVVQAGTVRGGIRVEQALTWTFPETLNPASAESLGKKLREALREANVPTAPVLACVGRECVILKELRYPAVPASEEPAIVRFQASKELTESLEDVIIDFTPMGNGSDTGERHALAVIVRKEVVSSLQGLCRGLGMKLLAVTPRPSAVIGALERSRPKQAPLGTVEALLTMGSRWADLGILRGQTLLFARSLALGPGLAAEVKRSLTVFNAGADSDVHSLFVASDGDETVLCGKLHDLLGLPVQQIDSFLPGDGIQIDKARRGRFTAAIGLLQRWADNPELGINFVSPKEPKPATDPRQRQKIFAGVMAAVVLLFVFIFGFVMLERKAGRQAELEAELKDLNGQFTGMAQEAANINALKDWDNTSISWLDELYDLTARFPNQKGFRLTSLTASPLTKKTVKDKYVASATLNGVAPAADVTLVHKLVEEINKVEDINKKQIYRATLQHSQAGASAQEFQVKVDLVHLAPDKYTTVLRVPQPLLTAPAPRFSDPRMDADEGGDE